MQRLLVCPLPNPTHTYSYESFKIRSSIEKILVSFSKKTTIAEPPVDYKVKLNMAPVRKKEGRKRAKRNP